MKTLAAAAFASLIALTAHAATPTYASLKGDAVHGKAVFGQCMACHAVAPGLNLVGPSLHAVVGRKAAIVPNFHYSSAMKGSGIVWTPEKLFVYLENPRGVVVGTKMAYMGLHSPQDRADVIAYLRTQR